jgi:nitrogen fixation NifU-like protein
MGFDDIYREIILDHYRHPRNAGLREPFDAQVFHTNGDGYDEVVLRVTLGDADGEPVVADVSYKALGCSVHQASTSIMTDLIIGKTVREATAVSDAFLELMRSRGNIEPDEDTLGEAVALASVSRYPARVKCALLGWMAWQDAMARAGNDRD